MELFIVVIILTVAVVVATGNLLWVWVGILAGALYVGMKAYRVRCPRCQMKTISGMDMKFCNQCGVEQRPRKGFRLRCESCHRLTRSELNMSYCNQCGLAL